MKESYSEDLANHTGPESCAVLGNKLGEALTGESVGEVLSFEIYNQGADLLPYRGRPHKIDRQGEIYVDPAESEALSMRGNSMHENREILKVFFLKGKERVGKAISHEPTVYAYRKSDDDIVPMKFANKVMEVMAE